MPMVVEPECPACGGTSAVTSTATAEATTYRCAATYAHDDRAPRFWTVPKSKPRAARVPKAPGTSSPSAPRTAAAKAAPATSAAELTAPLLAVLESLPAGWVEHGVIEYRLRVDRPDLFGRHVADAGHVLLRAGATRGKTASGLRFATALMRLEQESAVTHYNAPSTGAAWQQDKTVGYWALRPKPPRDQVITWEQYAVETLGRENGDWTDDDRTEVGQLAAQYGRR